MAKQTESSQGGEEKDRYSLEYLGSFGGPVRHKTRQGKLGVVSIGSCIEVLDCSDEARPRRLARRWMEGRVTGLDLAGNALYLAVRNQGIKILDVSDPAKPVERGAYMPFEMINRLHYYDVTVQNKVLFIHGFYAKSYTSVEAADIHDPWKPKHLAEASNSHDNDEETDEEKKVYALAGNAPPQDEEKLEYEPSFKDLAEIIPVPDRLGYIFRKGRLTTFDLKDADNPRELGKCSVGDQGSPGPVRENPLIVSDGHAIHLFNITDPGHPGYLSTIQILDRYALDGVHTLVAGGENGLTIYDLRDARHPRQISHFKTARPCHDFKIANHRAFVACTHLQIVNLTDPAHPRLDGIVHCEDPEAAEADHKGYEGFRAMDVNLCGHYALCGTSLIDISNPKIPKIINAEASARPFEIGMNVYIRTAPISIYGKWGIQQVTENDHDEDTINTRMIIYDMSDPERPLEAFTLKGLDEGAQIVGDRLYLSSEESGMIICKLKALEGPDENQTAGESASRPAFTRVNSDDGSKSQFAGLELIKIAGELACGRQGDRTLVTIDITKPAKPRLLGKIELPGPFGAMAIDDNNLYAGGEDGTISTVDISKPASPTLRGTFKLQEAPQAMAASGGRLYVAAGVEGLKIIDASAPDKLKELGTYNSPLPCTDLTTSGTMVFLATQGMEIVDSANPAAPMLRYRFPSFHNVSRLIPYYYGKKESSALEIKRLGNFVYLIGISCEEITKCQLLVFDVSNPDKPEGTGLEIEARGQDIDLKPKLEEVLSLKPTKYAGWLMGLPVKTPIVNGHRAAMMFYDLSDPGRPVFIGTHEGLTDPRKPVLYKNLVYLADNKGGLVILSRGADPQKRSD